jgi:phosphotransferase system HPr (HPr) family protein
VGDPPRNGVASSAPSADAEESSQADASEEAPAQEWVEQEARLVNEQGLHAYPAHVVAQVASSFKKEELRIRHGDHEVDAKSVIQLLGLSSEEPLVEGSRLLVRASGQNARTAAAVLAAVLASGFGED